MRKIHKYSFGSVGAGYMTIRSIGKDLEILDIIEDNGYFTAWCLLEPVIVSEHPDEQNIHDITIFAAILGDAVPEDEGYTYVKTIRAFDHVVYNIFIKIEHKTYKEIIT